MNSRHGFSRWDRLLAAVLGLVVALVVLATVIASRDWLLLIPGLLGAFFILSTVTTLRIGSKLDLVIDRLRTVELRAVVRRGWRFIRGPVALSFFSMLVLSAYVATPTVVLRWAIPGRSPYLQVGLLITFIAVLLVLATKIRTKQASQQFFRSRLLDFWFVISLLAFLPFVWAEDASYIAILPYYVLAAGVILNHAVSWYRRTDATDRAYLVGRITDRWTFMAPIFVLGLTLPIFAALSCFLAEHKLGVSLVPAREGVKPFQVDEYSHTVLLDFYLWHTVDLIPGINVPELLRWEPEYTYEDTLSGVLLLLFVVAIIRPTLSLYQVLKEHGENERNEPVAEPSS